MTADLPDHTARYEVVRELGRGGLGVVVLARHVALDRLVAIKRVSAAFALDESAREWLRDEARVLGRLQHPNIVRVFDLVDDGRDALIVMEYVAGTDLAVLTTTSPVARAAALVLLGDIAAALNYAHEQGVVHCDVKPSNVLVRDDGRAKVGDFGLAELLASPGASGDGPGVGTPGFMAPEQIVGAPTTTATDVYAYAATAYFLLTGRVVFEADDRAALLEAHLTATPVPPARVVRGFPARASDAIVAGLAKDPQRRPALPDLVRALTRGGGEAYPEPAWSPGPASAAPEPSRTEGAPRTQVVTTRHIPTGDQGRARDTPLDIPVYEPEHRLRRRTRYWFVAFASAAAAVAAIFGLAAIRHGTSQLSIADFRVVVQPTRAHCPQASFDFTATLHTNARDGDVVVQWIRPDGEHSPPQTLRARGATRTLEARLRFTVSGQTAAEVVATLDARSPTNHSTASASARYTCP